MNFLKQNRILTIAIPTYKRREIIAEGIKNIIDQGVNNICSILVIDDDSPDLTYEYLIKMFLDVPNLKIYKNKNRIGFAEQFFKLFDYCDTEYMLISCDEDRVINTQELIVFLKKYIPDYLSGAVIESNGKYYRKKKNGCIGLNDFRRSCNYISGTVYRVAAVNQYLDKIRPLIGKNNVAFLYPQVLLAIYLMAMHKSLWFPETIIIRKYKEKSFLVDLCGDVFSEANSRKKQFGDVNIFFENVLREYPQHIDVIKKMWEAEKSLKVYKQ